MKRAYQVFLLTGVAGTLLLAQPLPPAPPVGPGPGPGPVLAPLAPPPPPAPAALAAMAPEPLEPAEPPRPPEPAAMFAVDAALAQARTGLAFAPQADRDEVRRAREEARRAEHARRADDSYYFRGKQYLDRREYDRAIDSFNRVIDDKGARSDGALYWRAYAQNKAGKRDEAMASIAELRKSFPQSRWLDDAKALELEINQARGQNLPPEAASDEDLKLLALNSLMNTDPERSLPMLEKLLKSSASPSLKERALFVLAQSRSQQARNLIAQVARGGSNPDLQLKAIEYLGINGVNENRQLLTDVYKNSNDVAVRRAVLRSFMISHDVPDTLQVAKSESNTELRLDAIRLLGAMGASSEMASLYTGESSQEVKRAVIQGLMAAGDGQKLYDIAKNEKDATLRAEAIRMLGAMGRSKTGDNLAAMYKTETDPVVKREIINALFIQSNAPAIIEIARRESDQNLKKDAVQKLSLMHSKEATDYLMEILNK